MNNTLAQTLFLIINTRTLLIFVCSPIYEIVTLIFSLFTAKGEYMGLGAGLGFAMFLGCFASVYTFEKRRKLKAMREEEEEERARGRRGRHRDQGKNKDDKEKDKKVAWHS